MAAVQLQAGTPCVSLPSALRFRAPDYISSYRRDARPSLLTSPGRTDVAYVPSFLGSPCPLDHFVPLDHLDVCLGAHSVPRPIRDASPEGVGVQPLGRSWFGRAYWGFVMGCRRARYLGDVVREKTREMGVLYGRAVVVELEVRNMAKVDVLKRKSGWLLSLNPLYT